MAEAITNANKQHQLLGIALTTYRYLSKIHLDTCLSNNIACHCCLIQQVYIIIALLCTY